MNLMMIAAFVVLMTSVGVGGAGSSANLAFNGDFELASPQNPPTGWAMWGAEVFKNPAHFTRDTNNPHGGQACFRIFHPSNTAGYVVTDPQYAIRPKQGMMYRLSFWARTDKPGASLFGVTAYESVRPFVDAPSPGGFAIEVGAAWRQFTFEIHEGWDFFAERSRYLLLTFKATTDAQEEKTLWIDDVTVTEQPSPRQGRLVDEASLRYEPLQHRLRPNEKFELTVTVDAAKRLRRVVREVGGVSFHRVAGFTGRPYSKQGDYTLPPELEEAIRQMRLPMTRFYAVGDEPFGVEGAIDRVAATCRRLGIPEDRTPLELEEQGADSKLPPEVWAGAARYTLQKGYKFRLWEIANEPASSLWGRGKAFPSPDAYVEHFKAVSAAIRKVHPAAQIGVAIHPHNEKWGNYVLRQTAGHYDFVVGHYYCFANVNRAAFEDVALTENFKVLDHILRMNALIQAYNPGRTVYQLDTEWGMHSSGAQGERADYVDRNANIFGAAYRAVRLIYYAREGMLRGASGWQMLSRTGGQGFGVLFSDAPQARSLLYWLYYHFNRHVGEWVVEMDGAAPYHTPQLPQDRRFAGPLTPVLVTLSEDGGTLYAVIANGSWDKAVPCRAQLRDFRPARAAGVALSHSDPDGKPLSARKEEVVADLPVRMNGQQLTFTIPPHAVVFVTVEGK